MPRGVRTRTFMLTNEQKTRSTSRRFRPALQILEERKVPTVTVVGGLSNFDCTNNTGKPENEFEIELPSVDPAQIASFWANTPAYKGSGYGSPVEGYGPSSDGIVGHMSTYVDYKRAGISTPAGFTEHFGVHFVNPTFMPPSTIYTWKQNGVAANVTMPSVALSSTPNSAGGVTVTPVVTNNTNVPLVVQFHTSVVSPVNPDGVALGDLVDNNVEVTQTEAEMEAGDNGRTGVRLDPGQVLGIDGEAHDPTDPIIVDPQGWLRAHPGEGVSFGMDLNSPGDSELATLVVTDTAGNPVGEILSAVNTAARPVLSVPANQTVEATSANGATDAGAFTATATSSIGGSTNTVLIAYSVAGTQIPTSYVFPLGVTTVNVTAMDTAGQTSTGAFTVKVQDTTPPALTVPANLTVAPNTATGATVAAAFTATATDAVTANPTIAYTVGQTTIAPTYVFPSGDTTVKVTATDAAGNSSTKSFTVTVAGPMVTLSGFPTGPLYEEAQFRLTATASEPGYSSFTFSWTVTRVYNGVTTVTHPTTRPGANTVLDFESERLGTYTIAVVATDSRGFASLLKSVTFSILPEKEGS